MKSVSAARNVVAAAGTKRARCGGQPQRAEHAAAMLKVALGGTPFLAFHPLAAQLRSDILSPRQAIRAVKGARNGISTWRTSRADAGKENREAGGLGEAGL